MYEAWETKRACWRVEGCHVAFGDGAGYTEPISLDSAVYVVKFDGDGEVLWERERNGFSNVDAAERVALDEGGNVYVLGEVSPPGEPLHIWTAKYSPDGDFGSVVPGE